MPLPCLKGSPAHVSALTRPGTRPGIRPVIRDRRRRSRPRCPAFPPPFGRRHSLPGHPFPPGIPPPLRSAYHAATGGVDPDGVSMFRTRETRLAQGALFTPGTAVPAAAGNLPAARLPLSSGQPLFIPDNDPPRDVTVTRHQQGFTVIHPTPAFPSPVTPDGTGALGFSLSFEPRRAGPGGARQGGDRHGHCPDYVTGISQPPFDVLTHNVRPHVARSASSAHPGRWRARLSSVLCPWCGACTTGGRPPEVPSRAVRSRRVTVSPMSL